MAVKLIFLREFCESYFGAPVTPKTLVLKGACETNDTLDVGGGSKRYIFVPKTGVVKPKGIF